MIKQNNEFSYSRGLCEDDASTSLFIQRVRSDTHGHENISHDDEDN